MKDEIFSYTGDKLLFRETFYKLLTTKGKVTYYEAMMEFYKSKGEYRDFDRTAISNDEFYETAKNVVSHLIRTLDKYGCTIRRVKVRQTFEYIYEGADRDPLKNIQYKVLLEDRYKEIKDCIEMKQPCCITYKPFDRGKMSIIFHPHLLTEYNGRLFALGVSQKEGFDSMRCFTIALDRIQGKICGTDSSIQYIPALTDEYTYLNHLVGVSRDSDLELTSIRLRALDKYTFGRLTTKPIHWSQKAVLYPDFRVGRTYGEVEITVFPNLELQAQILGYGKNLVVISPDNYKKTIEDELKSMIKLYSNQ